MSIVPGTLVGSYRVVSQLGEGGMATVYYAEHVVLGRPAAIKVLHEPVARAPGLVERFINEAKIAAQMNHRNVVDVLDCGMFPAADAPGAQWYIALEYLNGKSLARFIAEHGGQPVDLRTMVHILVEAANGLHAAHERHGIVHRDIKPDNLYLIQTEDDPYRVKVLDFGIAKLREGAGGGLTLSKSILGTPAYAAPEQLRQSKDVDARADVWALGVVAYEMLTGVRPWPDALTLWELVSHHQAMTRPPDPRELRPDIPAKVAAVIAKAMEPDPSRRFKSAKAFATALADAAVLAWGTGMSIVEKYAPELTRAATDSLTVGRPLPPELAAKPPQIVTVPVRPGAFAAPPLTVSDGIPRTPGSTPRPAAPGTAPIAQPAQTISTISASSGQVVAPPAARSTRRPMLLAVGAAGLAAMATVAAIGVWSGSSGNNREGAKTAARETLVVDAGAPPRAEPAAAASALAIVTIPDGAEVFVDGVSKGSAPVNLQLPVGAQLELRAESPGHSAATRSVTVGASPATVRLELAELMDAGAQAPPETTQPAATPADKKGSGSHERKRHRHGAGEGSGRGSNDETFNPNDVL